MPSEFVDGGNLVPKPQQTIVGFADERVISGSRESIHSRHALAETAEVPQLQEYMDGVVVGR